MADALIESGVLSKKIGDAEQEFFVGDHISDNIGGRSYDKYMECEAVSYENQFHYRATCDLIIHEIIETVHDQFSFLWTVLSKLELSNTY